MRRRRKMLTERTRRTVVAIALLLSLIGIGAVGIWWHSSAQPLQLVWRRRLYADPSLAIYSLAFSPDGKMLAVGGFNEVQLWRTTSGQPIKVLRRKTIGETAISALAFSPDNKWLAVSDYHNDANIALWSLPNGVLRDVLPGHKDDTFALLFSPDGRHLFSGGKDGFIKVWQVVDGQLVREWKAHQGTVFSISLSPDGRWLASAGTDGTVKLWSREGSLIRILRGFTEGAFRVVFSPDGKWMAASGGDGTVKIWDLAKSSLTATFQVGKFPRLAAAHQSPLLAIGHFSVELRQIPDGCLISEHKLGWSWAFTRWMHFTFLGGTWQLPDPFSVRRIPNFVYGGLAFSPDGKFLAVGDTAAVVWLFRVQVGKPR